MIWRWLLALSACCTIGGVCSLAAIWGREVDDLAALFWPLHWWALGLSLGFLAVAIIILEAARTMVDFAEYYRRRNEGEPPAVDAIQKIREQRDRDAEFGPDNEHRCG